jgi:hypothetical protein
MPDFHRYGFEFTPADGPTGLPPDVIMTELAIAKRPLGYYRQDIGGGDDHIMVISGYSRTRGFQLAILDPLQEYSELPYEKYVGGRPNYGFEHYRTYYEVRKTSSGSPDLLTPTPTVPPAFASFKDDRMDEILRRAAEYIQTSIPSKGGAKDTFKELAAQGILSGGGKLPGNPSDSQLAEVLPTYVVRVDEVARLDAAIRPPSELLNDYGDLLYLIRINGIPASTVYLHRTDSIWKLSGYGTTLLAQQIDGALKALPSASAAALRFLVKVPGLGVIFLGYVDGDGVIKLTTVKTNDMLEVGAHDVLPASEMFTRLRASTEKFR